MKQSFTSFLTLFVSWIIRELINLQNWDKLLLNYTKLSGSNFYQNHGPWRDLDIFHCLAKSPDPARGWRSPSNSSDPRGHLRSGFNYLITVAFLFQRIIVWQVCEFFCWRITKLIFILSYQLNFTFDRWWNVLIWIWRHNTNKMILKRSF